MKKVGSSPATRKALTRLTAKRSRSRSPTSPGMHRTVRSAMRLRNSSRGCDHAEIYFATADSSHVGFEWLRVFSESALHGKGRGVRRGFGGRLGRSEEHTSELQSL